jgi:predicted enzyme related to lactoylglutathione lyase
VADTDRALERAVTHGGQAGPAEDFSNGRLVTITDPFGTELSVITRPPGAPS